MDDLQLYTNAGTWGVFLVFVGDKVIPIIKGMVERKKNSDRPGPQGLESRVVRVETEVVGLRSTCDNLAENTQDIREKVHAIDKNVGILIDRGK